MLNKKGFTFTEITDVGIGLIIFIIAFLVFSSYSNIFDIKFEEQKFQEINSFEFNEQKIDLINFVSDPEISEFFLYFNSNPNLYCSRDIKNIFRDKLQFKLWSISLYEEDKIIFSCSSDIFYKEDAITEKINIPAKDPGKTRILKLEYIDE